MKTSDELLQSFNLALDGLSLDQSPARLYEPIRYVLSMGGKRIRPVMCMMACEMFGQEPEQALWPAMALEVFHNFTLLHDDIMDKAPTRRNLDCVHVKWNENVAILSGDAMQILAYQLLGRSAPDYLAKALPLFSRTAIEVCEGQQYDMDFETMDGVTVDEYMHMIRLKTAVLLAASLQMGALAGGAPDSDAGLLYDFGIETGLAFQLKDDLLDVYGCPTTFGKRIGGDIVCNKKTFMLINALAMASPSDKAELDYWLANPDRPEHEKIAAVTRIYDQAGVREVCIREMERHQQKAYGLLARVNLPDERKAMLVRLANELTDRNK